MNWNDVIPQLPQLAKGDHPEGSGALCAMEMVAWLAGEPHTDNPVCTDPVLAEWAITINDRSQHARLHLLPRLLPDLIGTASSSDVSRQRASSLAMDAVRVIVPVVLRGRITDSLVDAMVSATTPDAARAAADAAARAAANAAARAAYAARAAARAAAGAAARAAANAAADAAADAVARAAADTVDVWPLVETSIRKAIAIGHPAPVKLDPERVRSLCGLGEPV